MSKKKVIFVYSSKLVHMQTLINSQNHLFSVDFLLFLTSTIRRWDYSAAIQALFSFLGIRTKEFLHSPSATDLIEIVTGNRDVAKR